MKKKMIIVEDNGLTEYLKANGFKLTKNDTGDIIMSEDMSREIDECVSKAPANAPYSMLDYGFASIPETPEEEARVKEIIKDYD